MSFSDIDFSFSFCYNMSEEIFGGIAINNPNVYKTNEIKS